MNRDISVRAGYRFRRRFKRTVLYISVAIVSIVLLFPLFWMFSSALRPQADLYSQEIQLLPHNPTMDNFHSIFFLTDFFSYYMNSILVSLGVVMLTTTLATFGGYGLSRVDFRFKDTFARGILLGYMFPPILLAIPMFILWRQLGILNTYPGLILAETAQALPFSLWLMWKFFQTVPYSLEESAQMMGASRFKAFYDVALPMAKPGIIAVAIFAYAVSWNAYTIPKIILTDNSRWVLTIGIESFIHAEKIFWGQVMAASAMVILPSFLFVYFLQKYLLRGFRAGSIG